MKFHSVHSHPDYLFKVLFENECWVAVGFKYKKGSDSVLVVTKDDYSNCNTKNPIKGLTEGDSVFSFDRSGAFYFISGNVTHCKHGQKMIVVVLAVRGHQAPPAEIPAKSPSSSVSSPPPIMAVPAPAASSSAALHIFALTSGCSVGLSVYFPFALVGLL